MKAVIGDDPLHTADAEREVGLAQLLGNDLGGGLRVEETVAQDLAHGLVGAAVMGFGAGLLGVEGGSSALLEGVEDLIVALPAIAIFLGDAGDIGLQTLALHKHEEAAGDFVVGLNGQGAGWAGEFVRGREEFKRSFHEGEFEGGEREMSNKIWH